MTNEKPLEEEKQISVENTDYITHKFDEILLKHKQMFEIYKKSKPEVEGMSVFQDLLDTVKISVLRMAEELILVGNNYIADNNIIDETEMNKMVKKYYTDFSKFVIFYE